MNLLYHCVLGDSHCNTAMTARHKGGQIIALVLSFGDSA